MAVLARISLGRKPPPALPSTPNRPSHLARTPASSSCESTCVSCAACALPAERRKTAPLSGWRPPAKRPPTPRLPASSTVIEVAGERLRRTRAARLPAIPPPTIPTFAAITDSSVRSGLRGREEHHLYGKRSAAGVMVSPPRHARDAAGPAQWRESTAPSTHELRRHAQQAAAASGRAPKVCLLSFCESF
eukprot:scaffold260363_cov31-Tisochrysis_lutea.AAC.3